MNKKVKMICALTVVFCVFCLCFSSCSFNFDFGSNKGGSSGLDENDPLNKFDLLRSSIEYANEVYYGDVDLDVLDKIAALAVINNMDRFNSMSEYDGSPIATSSSEGLGISVSNTVYNEHIVSYVFNKRDTTTGEISLAQPELKRGDRIYAIDGNRVEGLETAYLSYYVGLKTEIGDSYELSVYRDGELLNINVSRCVYIPEQSFYIDNLGGGISDDIGYIKLLSFTGTAESDFKNDIEQFTADGNKCLILDLRDNGGGSSSILESISSYLCAANQSTIHLPLIELHEEKSDRVITYKTKDCTKYIDCPIYVLTNSATASASEALISALMYYETATIIGTQTYGKGVAQITNGKAVTDDDGTDYSITMVVGRYYVFTNDTEKYPDGKYCINEVGITPDYVMQQQSFVKNYYEDAYILKADTLYKESLAD